MFIDVHCHLEMIPYTERVISRARKNSVGAIVANSVDFETAKKVLDFTKEFKEVKAALGIYPIEALKLSDDEIDEFIDFVKKSKVVAIGEVGMDFKETEERERQKINFRKFVELAIELDVPVIVHSRGAEAECIEILEKLGAKKAVMHYFSGKKKLVERIVENGWMLSIPTAVAYSRQFQENVSIVPISNLLCETDSPYSHPEKGFPNEPANVVASYEAIARIKGLSLKEVEKIVQGNFKRVF